MFCIIRYLKKKRKSSFIGISFKITALLLLYCHQLLLLNYLICMLQSSILSLLKMFILPFL